MGDRAEAFTLPPACSALVFSSTLQKTRCTLNMCGSRRCAEGLPPAGSGPTEIGTHVFSASGSTLTQ